MAWACYSIIDEYGRETYIPFDEMGEVRPRTNDDMEEVPDECIE